MDPAKIHILVLDRNLKSAYSIRQTLVSIGYQVFVTAHESEAAVLAEQKLFNLVVKAFDPNTVDAIGLMNRIRAITPTHSSSSLVKGALFKLLWTPYATVHTTICRDLSTLFNWLSPSEKR
jgi:CheY-like chemotaxis protein